MSTEIAEKKDRLDQHSLTQEEASSDDQKIGALLTVDLSEKAVPGHFERPQKRALPRMGMGIRGSL